MIRRLKNSFIYRFNQLSQAKNRAARLSQKASSAHRLLFVVQGWQGQWVGMGQGLYSTEPVFRETVQRCSRALERRLGEIVLKAFEKETGNEIHPAEENEFHTVLFHSIVHLGLFDLWASRGVLPDAVIGLSLGEITSPYAAGALSLEETMAIAHSGAQRDERRLARGKHFLLQANLEEARRLCRECPAEVELFVEFSPTATMAFCIKENVETVTNFLNERNVGNKIYIGGYAYHTPRFAACRDSMAEELKHLAPQRMKSAFYSSLAGGRAPQSTYFDSDYWYWMLAKPVFFGGALETALADDFDTILNIGPHPALTPYVKEIINQTGREVLILDSMRADEPEKTTFERTYQELKKRCFVRKSEALLANKNSADTLPPKSISDLAPVKIDAGHNPYSDYERLRQQGAVHFIPGEKHWLVLDYKDVAAVLKQPQTFSSAPARGLDSVLLGADLPEHTRANRLLAPYFSPAAMAKMKIGVESLARQLIENLHAEKTFDIVNDFAVPLTERVIAEFIGLDDNEFAELRKQIGADKYQLNYYRRLEDFFAAYVNRIETKPADNFCRQLLDKEAPDKFAPGEIVSLLKLLWVAGTTTASILISTSALILLQHPAVKFEVQHDFNLLPLFIEEVLRFEAPEQSAWRVTSAETKLAGVTIPANSTIKLCLGAANRDAKQYPNPDLFILRRNPKDHLAFGAGIHYCLGAGLARMEARAALKELFRQVPDLRPANPSQTPAYVESPYFRALKELGVQTAEL